MKTDEKLDDSLKLIVKTSFFVFFLLVFSKIIAYAYRAVIARMFGAEVYGLFSLALIIFSLFILFSSLGIYDGVLRFISFYRGKKGNDEIRYITRVSIKILLFSSIIAAIISFIFSDFIAIHFFHNPDLIIFIRILSFIIPFHMIGYLFLSFMQSFEKIRIHSFISDFLFNLINLISIFILVYFGFKSNSVVLSYSIGIFGIFILSFIYCKSKIPQIFEKPNLKKPDKIILRKSLISYSWPLIFSGILFGILPSIDSICIGFFKNASEVGIYNAALPLAGLIVFFPGIILRLFFPIVTKEFSTKNMSVIEELSKQISKWFLIINLPIVTMLFIFPGAFLNILFGSNYLPAITSLKILAIGFFFFAFSVIFTSLISMIGKSKTILINNIIVVILNIMLNIIFIPIWGINGAAFATTISYIFLCIVFFFQVKHYTSIIPLRRKMVRIIFSIIIAMAVFLFFKQFIQINIFTIIVQGIFFTVFYLLLLILTKSLDKNDWMILNALKRKYLKM